MAAHEFHVTGHVDLSPLNDPVTTGDYLDLTVQTLAHWRSQNIGLSYVKVGRLIRYKREDILNFVDSNTNTVA